MKNRKKEKEGNSAFRSITGCARCGTCCLKGGPALHKEDRDILLAGHLGLKQLITLRKGELAFSPLNGKLEPLHKELVKIAGKGKGWSCCFYDAEKASCTIYCHRPLECRLLKCWETEKLLSVIGKDTLSRADILGRDDPIMEYVETHEAECSLEKLEELISVLPDKKDGRESFEKMSALIQRDLAIRSRAIVEFGLSVEAELFIFGRPLFKILNARGFQTTDLMLS